MCACYMRSGTKNNLVYYILPLEQLKILHFERKIRMCLQDPEREALGGVVCRVYCLS